MDISAAIADMLDCVDRSDFVEAAECARNIKRWLYGGGFVPAGWTAKTLRAVCNVVIDKAD